MLVIRRIGWYRQILRSLQGYDGSYLKEKITCPVLALHGSNDNVIPLSSARTIPQMFPDAYFEIIEGAGHAMVYTEGKLVGELLLRQCP
ncbi:MAG: alpha/beta fold hydrolase [Chitinivibrionales bacterium]|nr:alpha/beta fold hydrolase [Chitinivibrionales bacterium]